MSKPRIGFLGLGIMGGGMSRRLIAAGYPIAVYNRTRAKADSLVAAGATSARSAREAAVGAEIIVSMVADDDASMQRPRLEAAQLPRRQPSHSRRWNAEPFSKPQGEMAMAGGSGARTGTR